MSKFKTHLAIALTVAVLAAIGARMDSKLAAADTGPTVTIGGPIPLPVTGNVGVVGTPNVNIGNTPTVTIANTPLPTTISGPVAAIQSGKWNVDLASTTAAPALVLDISKSAAQHIELLCTQAAALCSNTAAPPPAPAYMVPAGESLVVTSLDFTTVTFPGTTTSLNFEGSGSALVWFVPNDGLTHSFQYPNGFAFPAGYQFNSASIFLGPNFNRAVMEGYLTPN